MEKIIELEKIKNLESIPSKGSDMYVPISTYDFIKKLDNFEFKYAKRYRSGSNSHYAVLGLEGKNVNLYIENSHDRTLSLRISFQYNNFVFGNIRTIHKGNTASNIINYAADINTWYRNAIQSINTMKNISLSKDEMIDIASKAFEKKGIKLSVIDNFNYEHSNALEFVMYLINGIVDGIFNKRSIKNIKTIKGTKNQILLVQISNTIWNYLVLKYPELFI